MSEYFSNGLRVEQFRDLSVDTFAGRQAQTGNGAAFLLKNGVGVSVVNSRAIEGTQTFLRMDHVTDRRVFANYDLAPAAKAIDPADQRFDTQTVGRAPRTAKR